ncbi:hypothetical protein [Nocardia sp. NPDC059239]|uniref:hypothetical protein n=1 Tax=Nocardia sp. NPDC059239 TaxID=3346785 RepID=UPI0036CBD825
MPTRGPGACNSACDALGETLTEKFALDEGTTEQPYGDPMIGWDGPGLAGFVEQMLRLAVEMREICEHIADTTVIPDQRKAAARAARTANFVWMQYGVG